MLGYLYIDRTKADLRVSGKHAGSHEWYRVIRKRFNDAVVRLAAERLRIALRLRVLNSGRAAGRTRD